MRSPPSLICFRPLLLTLSMFPRADVLETQRLLRAGSMIPGCTFRTAISKFIQRNLNVTIPLVGILAISPQ